MTIDTSLLPAGSRVLCAVSGGADSMCLLHLLWSRREALGLEVLAAHYEHGLRGEESLRDAAFVRDWCREQGIPLILEHGDAAGYAKSRGLGIEEAARALRYAFLERAAGERGCDLIATAHNAEDNAETVLFHLVRGSGAAGLSGIPPRRGRIVRPLLGVSRREIGAYLAREQVPHVEDSSNASEAYSRNLLRCRVLPVLEELNPAFPAAAGRAARLLREDEACLSGLAEDFIRAEYDGESLLAEKLLALPWSVSSRVLRRLCPRPLSLEHVEAALALAGGSGLAWADLPGLRLRREQGRLYFAPEGPVPSFPDRVLRPGQDLEIPELGLLVRAQVVEALGEIHGLFKTYCLKCENIYGDIVCGPRRGGDKLRPAGRGCTKSLKSLFAEAGMTRRQRELAPVLRDGAGVLAVPGLAVAERAAPVLGDRALKIEIVRIERDKEHD